jgi:hypothetical protein
MNVYEEYVVQKGYTLQEVRKPIRPEVPKEFQHIYATYEEYRQALHDFLNGI